MTTPSTPRKAGPLLGTGAQTSWPFTFKVFAASDIAVTIANNLGVETALVLNADYSVTLNSNQDTSPGGTVTYPISGSALPTGSKLTIIGNLPYDQPLDLPSGGNFSPLALENQLDRLTMQIQQLREQLGRSLTVPVTSGVSPSLPSPAASNIIGWNENGDNLENYPLSELATSLAFATYRYDTFTGNGSTTQFTLSADPTTLGNLDVAVGGVTQTPVADYLLVGGVIEFTSAPPLGATILARFGEGIASGPSMDSYDVRFRQAGTGSVDRTAEAKMRETVSVRDFGAVGDGVADDTAAVQAAVAATNTSGQWLNWNKGTYRITSALAFTLTKMQWMSEGAVIFVDTAGDILRGVNVTLSDATEHQLLGAGFEVNANGKCHGALRFIQPLGTQTASIYLEKVGARNVQMQVGAGVGSSGVDVRGGFKQVKLVDCYAENMMMRTGAGVLGANGITGIILQNNFGVTGAYIKNMILVRPTINRVYSQDATYQYDMDGIGLFANPADSTFGPAYAEVTSSDISGCWGRDIKTQVSAAKIDSPNSLINAGPTGGIINPAYDFQTGPGLVIGGQYTVDGVSHLAGLVAFQITTAGTPTSSRWDGGAVDIINGGALTRAVGTDSIGVVTKFVVSVSNVSVRGAVTNFALQRTNGFDIHTIKLDGIVCGSITDALVNVISGSGGSAPYRGRVYVKNCINLGSEVPTVRCNTSGSIAGALLDDIGGIGFGPANVVYSGGATTISGLSIDNSAQFPIPLNNNTNSGTEKLYSFGLDAGAEITLPTQGFNGNYLAQLVIGTNRTGFAVLSVDGSGITSIDVGAGANIGTTSDPGSGDLRVWRSTGTNQLVVKNGTASGRVFLVKFFG